MNMAVLTVVIVDYDLHIDARAVTASTLVRTGGYHLAMGIRRMRLEVNIVVIRISFAVTIRTAALITLSMTRCVTVCQVAERTV